MTATQANVRTQPVIQATELGRTYHTGPHPVVGLHDFNASVEASTLTVIRGRSGSGKTTLLNLLGGLDEPTAGSVQIGDLPLSDMDEAARSQVRRTQIGFIFQAFGLLPILTAAENIEIPMRLVHTPAAERRARSAELLDQVGLAERGKHRPDELSGGEQQRVAIARALANRPRILLADEPTGQLDSRTGQTIIDLLVRVVRADGVAAIVATHDHAPLERADRVIELSDGAVLRDDRRLSQFRADD